jgi:hypothetical protein
VDVTASRRSTFLPDGASWVVEKRSRLSVWMPETELNLGWMLCQQAAVWLSLLRGRSETVGFGCRWGISGVTVPN